MNTPDTLVDMISGFVAFFLLIGAYVLSLVLRLRRVRQALKKMPSAGGE